MGAAGHLFRMMLNSCGVEWKHHSTGTSLQRASSLNDMETLPMLHTVILVSWMLSTLAGVLSAQPRRLSIVSDSSEPLKACPLSWPA